MPEYQEFEASLQELQPRFWRRFLLRTTSTFAQLHQAIQQSFDWQESHLWEFRLPTHRGRPIAGLPGGEAFERPTPDAPDGLAVWLDGWRPYAFDLAKTKAEFDR